jgi:hypothetical protein
VQGEALLGQDKCGEAIRSLQESKKLYREAREFAAEYAKTKVSQARYLQMRGYVMCTNAVH